MTERNCHLPEAPSDAADQLRKFCLSLLELAKEERADFIQPFVERLSDSIQSGCQRRINSLRQEIKNLDETAAHLKSARESSFYQLGNEADVVLERLQSNRRQLNSLLIAFEALRSQSPETHGPAKIELGQPPRVLDDVVPLPTDRHSDPLDATVLNSSTCESVTPIETSVDRLFREAEESRRKGEYSHAEQAYTEVLKSAGEFSSARLHRGRVRLLMGKPDEAIQDFTVVIDGNQHEPMAHLWRADAWSLKTRFESAIADYDQALTLQPNLLLPRYNRAVAYRLSGQLCRALEEFDHLAKRQPQHAGVYLNRGIVHELQGDFHRASMDYRKSLRFQPKSQEALQRLQAVRVLAEEKPTSLSSKPVTAQINPAPKTVELKALNLTTTEIESVDESDSASPGRELPDDETNLSKAGRSAQAPREIRDSLKVHCPACDEETAIPWNKLEPGRVLSCPHCSRNFIMRPSGDLSEVIRSGGRWEFLQRRQQRQQEVHQFRLRVASIVAVALLLVGAIWWPARMTRSSAVVEKELPAGLESRVELFARAWFDGDSRTMRRLTDPTQDRLLFVWCRSNPPPVLPDQADGADKPLKIEIAKLADRHPLVWYQVKFQANATDKAPPSTELRIAWEERADTWHFQPAPRG